MTLDRLFLYNSKEENLRTIVVKSDWSTEIQLIMIYHDFNIDTTILTHTHIHTHRLMIKIFLCYHMSN